MTPVSIIGCGAVGYPLAAFLTAKGCDVVAVRTGDGKASEGMQEVTVRHESGVLCVAVRSVRLSRVKRLEGVIVITAKAFANPRIAERLEELGTKGTIVVLQNGLGVEKPFLNGGWEGVLRGVLYLTSQALSEREFSFRSVRPSPIGVIEGDRALLGSCIDAIDTSYLPFAPEVDIQREIWKKVIVNCVFNSVCPLLESNNGVFALSGQALNLARELVCEARGLTTELGISISEEELMAQILQISDGSTQWISTLQDIRHSRPTEMEFLNLEMARIAAELNRPVQVPMIEVLGKMIELKARKFHGC